MYVPHKAENKRYDKLEKCRIEQERNKSFNLDCMAICMPRDINDFFSTLKKKEEKKKN